MKQCISCNQSGALSEFYEHPYMADGHLNKCKLCCRRDANNHRRENLDRVRQYDRKRGMEPHRIIARYFYDRTPQGRQAHNRASQLWNDKNPRKRAAHILFRNRSLCDSSLAKKPCERCGSENAHAHHENYDKPLEVAWLCPIHHKQRHREMASTGIAP